MPWNGSGTYVLNPSFSPEVNGTTIDAVRYNGLTTDVAVGITAALAKNGENVPTANLPMGGFKHTGAAAGTGAGQYLSYNQTGAVLTDLTVTTLTATNFTWTGLAAGVAAYLVSPGPIGGTTPNTGAFTNLSATGTVSGAGFTARFAAPGPIGNTTPSTGAFTTLSSSGGITGSGSAITALNASNLASGTVPDARFPATLPAASGANLTNLPAAQLTGNIAAARLTSIFPSSLASAGYQTLSTGLIIQWGNNSVGSNSVTNVTLPLAFPNNFFQAFGSVDDSDTNNDFRVGAGITSLSQIQLVNGEAAGSRTIRWLAIGN